NLGVLCKSRGDEKKAEEWYLKSAERGNAVAMFNLGALYLSRGDLRKAWKWYLQAAEKGCNLSHELFGRLMSVKWRL
ncbi:MAG: hypothetical protein N3G21_10690, partial [Candidatus Hydrogenedentes bacterium]|nr:hypothetical protein [Candidatus Hydrogenedentota bacterium]